MTTSLARRLSKKSELRLAVVQTSRGFSPEIDVFVSLASAIADTAQERNYLVKILLIQGTDERYGPAKISKTITMFETIANLEIIPLRMGGLDRSGTTRLKKLLSTMALLLQLPGLYLSCASGNLILSILLNKNGIVESRLF